MGTFSFRLKNKRNRNDQLCEFESLFVGRGFREDKSLKREVKKNITKEESVNNDLCMWRVQCSLMCGEMVFIVSSIKEKRERE